MRILLANRYFGGEHVPTGRMLFDLACELSSLGHRVEVLTSKAVYAKAFGHGSGPREGEEQTRLRYVWTGPAEKRPAEWFLFWSQACLRIPLLEWDRCIILTDPPFMGLAAALSRLRGRRGVFWWTMDLYPESLIARNMIKRGRPLEHALSAINEVSLRSLEGVICLGERQRRHLERYRNWRDQPGFCLVVPPWDRRPMAPIDRKDNRFRKAFGWEKKRLALYAGNLGEAHSFEEIVRAARMLAARGDESWVFVFVVRGSKRRLLEAAGTGLPNLAVLDYQPPELTADMLWSADVHVITMSEGWAGVVVPSKLYGILQTAAPVLFIGPDDADTAGEVRRLRVGEVAPSGADGERIVGVLERLAGLPGRAHGGYKEDGPRRIADFVCARRE